MPRSLFETRGWGGTQVRQGSPHPPTLRAAHPAGQKHNRDRTSRFARSNVLEHFDDRMFETFWGQNVMSSPFSPRRGRRTSRCARAPRQLPRRADGYRGQPSTPPPNTSQPPYRPAGHGCPKGSPERHGGPKGFGHGGPLIQLCSVSRPCGRSGSRRCAVWTLAAWRRLILHARLGLR